MKYMEMTNRHCGDYAIELWLETEYAEHVDCGSDLPEPQVDDDLRGLTVLDHVHINARGSIIATRFPEDC